MESWVVHALKRVVVGAVMAVPVMCVVHVAPALAHSMLVKAEPPRRALLAKAPAQVRLWFNEEIEGDYASLVVLDAAKQLRMIRSPSSCHCRSWCPESTQ
jgi:methionine-rich copper-binding protein CopC